jgi:hypothetical protein
MIRPNPLDLRDVGLRLMPNNRRGYDTSPLAFGFRRPLGSSITLSDDDTREIALPFAFPYFGQQYSQAFVNSDGNLTFTEGRHLERGTIRLEAPERSSADRALFRRSRSVRWRPCRLILERRCLQGDMVWRAGVRQPFGRDCSGDAAGRRHDRDAGIGADNGSRCRCRYLSRPHVAVHARRSEREHASECRRGRGGRAVHDGVGAGHRVGDA